MSEKAPKPTDRVKLDVETILQTAEGRHFLNQLNFVSQIVTIKDSQVEFKGEQMVKTGYVADCKSVQLFKCPDGYFLFCNKAATKNNWSVSGRGLEEVLSKLYDNEIKNKLEEELASAEAAAE
ncbi:MAG: hypothetical protein O7G31_07075 [Calditrichaeota bacterium]|nr:hypothetical protein [candidate division KSB1 bacterium]MCZ6819239.1 hypothetical protein [Calditrichota bacterium]TDI84050.1 MAG: hypothetical protein E2O78_07030 [Caldithrix sp.]